MTETNTPMPAAERAVTPAAEAAAAVPAAPAAPLPAAEENAREPEAAPPAPEAAEERPQKAEEAPEGAKLPGAEAWLRFAAAFPDVAREGSMAPEVVQLIRAGLDPIAAQAGYENHRLQLRVKALEAAARNAGLPGSASGTTPPAADPFLEGLAFE